MIDKNLPQFHWTLFDPLKLRQECANKIEYQHFYGNQVTHSLLNSYNASRLQNKMFFFPTSPPGNPSNISISPM